MALTSTRRAVGPIQLGLVAVVIALAIGACGGDDATPEAGASTAGEELYQQSCASCHGTDLSGTAMGPSHLSQVYAPDHHPDASFRAAITQGSPAHHWELGDMPPVEGLDDAEIELIIAYVREQQEIRGLEPYPPG
jgi:mono/diheme cytochrome c family protein